MFAKLEGNPEAEGDLEKKVLMRSHKCASLAVVGQQTGQYWKTVQNKLRLMAGSVLVGSRARWVSFLDTFETHYKQTGRTVDRILYVTKQAFDGFRITLRVQEQSAKRGATK